MHVESFSSHEEMTARLAEHQRHAMEGMHLSQSALKYGDHWVRFVDLDAKPPIIEFGRILTAEELARDLVDDDTEWAEVQAEIEAIGHRLDHDGLMYGWAASHLNPGGELGTTHKASVWPIERRLYRWAHARMWDVTQREPVTSTGHEDIGVEAGRLLLEIAFRAMRTHYLPERGQ